MIKLCQQDDFRPCFTLLPSIFSPPHSIPALSSDWNLETHLLSCSQTQLRPCQVVCARPPQCFSPPSPPLSSPFPFFLSYCSLLSSLSPRRLLQALWRICPNYLSYWQLRVNKLGKCVAFSVLPPSLSPSLPQPYAILSHFKPPSPFFSIHHIFPPFLSFLPSTSISPCCLYLLLSFSVSVLSLCKHSLCDSF